MTRALRIFRRVLAVLLWPRDWLSRDIDEHRANVMSLGWTGEWKSGRRTR